VVCVLLASTFLLLGHFASKAARWAFWIGIAVYIIDTLLWALLAFATPRNWLAVLFHCYALFNICRGLNAVNSLGTLPPTPAPTAQPFPYSPPGMWPPAPTQAAPPTAPLAGPQRVAGSESPTAAPPPPTPWPSAPPSAKGGPDWNSGIASRPRSKLYDEQGEG
jgi:hypothetical protein